jgi:hypothetical protein
MAAVRVAAKIKQLNDASFFLMDAKDIETKGGTDLQTFLDDLSGGAVEDIEELKTLVGKKAYTDNTVPDSPVDVPSTGMVKDVEDIQATIGVDAVIDDSDPDNPVETSPATGIKKDIADLKKAMDTNVCDVDKILYTQADFPTIATVKDALDQLFEDLYYLAPEITSFTTTPTSLTFEIGSTVNTIDFTWALNKEVTSVTLTDCTIADPADTTAQYATPLTTDKEFVLTVTDGKETATAKKNVKFLPYVYYGKAAAPDGVTTNYDDTFVLGLPQKAFKSNAKGSYDMTLGVDEFGYLALPASFGTPKVKIGGFDTELDLAATFDHTNASGYQQSYNVFKTGNANLGAISMVVE